MSAADKHNQLAREFVEKVASQTTSYSEMMAVVESTILAAMFILHRRDRMAPAGAVEMIEQAIHQATHRFAAIRKQEATR